MSTSSLPRRHVAARAARGSAPAAFPTSSVATEGRAAHPSPSTSNWSLLIARSLLLLTAVSWCSLPGVLHAQGQSKSSILIDPTAVVRNPRALAELQELIARAVPEEDWPRTIIQSGDSFLGLSQRLYRYPDGTHPLSAQKIAELIAEANSLETTSVILPGQTIVVPPLPVRPYERGARPDRSQLLDLMRGEVALAHPMEAAPPVPEPAPAPAPVALALQAPILRSASSWRIDGPTAAVRGMADALDSSTPPDAPVPYFIVPKETTLQVSRLNDERTSGPQTVARWPAIPELVSASLTSTRSLVLLDYYDAIFPDESCPHGRRVIEAASHAFSSIGAPTLVARLRPQEIDFYRHKDKLKPLVEEYVDSHAPGVARGPRSLLENALAKQDASPDEVPAIYIMALYWKLVRDKNVAVVSTSVSMQAQDLHLLPPTFYSTPPLLLAALNSGPLLIEDSLDEPVLSFYIRRIDAPVILVGGLLANSIDTIGKLSKEGDDAACLGLGQGWGGLSGMCLQPDEPGTSFAAPSIAALLFAYSEYLRGQSLQVSPAELRRRLFLSVDFGQSVRGHHAAPGVPRPEILFRLSNSPLLLTRGGVERWDRAGGFVTLDEGGIGSAPVTLGLQEYAARGLDVQDDGRCALFVPAARRWTFHKIASLALILQRGDSTETIDLATFRARGYQRLVLTGKE